MLKFNCLFLTVALSFFTLFLNKTEGDLTFKKNLPTHNLQDYHSLNTSAISVNNSFEELLTFHKHNQQPSVNHFFTISRLNEMLLGINLNYLKVCDFFDLNLTIGKIIYPFHSFL